MRKQQGIHNIRCFGEEGFSLVELLIVVGLMAVMMAIAITGIRSEMPKIHANGTARDIAGRLMMARLKAVQNNGGYGVSFTPGVAGSYMAVKNSAGSASSCGSGTWLNDSVATQATTDVTIALTGGSSCSHNRVEFYPNGTMCGCDNIVITAGNNQMTVT